MKRALGSRQHRMPFDCQEHHLIRAQPGESSRSLRLAVRQHRQHSGCEVTVGGESGEAGRQTGAYDAWRDKDEPKESKAVLRGDCTLRIEPVRRLEPGPQLDAEKTEQFSNSSDEFGPSGFVPKFCQKFQYEGIRLGLLNFRVVENQQNPDTQRGVNEQPKITKDL